MRRENGRTPIDDGNLTFPSLFVASDLASDQSQRAFLKSRAIEFSSLVLAGGLGEIPRNTLRDVGPKCAVVFFIIALGIRVSGVGESAEKRWYESRAGAESVKSLSWKYAIGGKPFEIDNANSKEDFIRILRSILGELGRLDQAANVDSDFAVTSRMTDVRSSSLEERRIKYVEQRVKNQAAWYSLKAGWNRRRANIWRVALLTLESLALTLGILRILGTFDVNWLGILSTAAAAAAAWQQVKNFTVLSVSYAVTSHEVKLVASSLNDAVDEGKWSQAVADAEDAFSREHQLWLSKRHHINF